MDIQAEKYSIKNMLFSKIIPNYVIPLPTKGYKVYGCTDCGDKFLLQSSYEYHVNRKSLQITFTCRVCNTRNIFFNRCTLLSHIRSHAFKTATININDIIIEPLPLSYFKIDNNKTGTNANSTDSTKPTKANNTVSTKSISNCYECKAPLKGALVDHLMNYRESLSFMCPLCPFVIPTICGLQCHIRLHIGKPPFMCPECGWSFRSKMALKHNNHQCLGFKILRGSARFQCEAPDCDMLYHPDHHTVHLSKYHVKKVYKCPLCVVACFGGPIMESHMLVYHPGTPETTPIIFYQCDLCPERLVLENQLENHLTGHEGKHVYPCRTCGAVFLELLTLIKHYMDNHGQHHHDVSKVLDTILSNSKDTYSVVKKCEKCQRYFKYKCKYSDIDDLPTDCPYKCSNARTEIQNVADEFENEFSKFVENNNVSSTVPNSDTIKCYLCKLSMPENWTDIKKHFFFNHRNIKCVDVKVNLSRIDSTRGDRKKHKIGKNKRKRNSRGDGKMNVAVNEKHTDNSPLVTLICKKCEKPFDTKELLSEHIISHRDPYMAYQCKECGDNFAVKPSFSLHLLIEHNISNPDEYITINQCYNEDALIKNDLINVPLSTEPLKENQCNICRDQFDNLDDLEKHYRVHGMAFLKKNTSKPNSNSP